MPDEMPAYNLAAVRDLLLDAFSAEDLRRLLFYTSRRALKPLIHEISPGDGLAAMVDKTTVFCHKQSCIPDLLAEVEEANPRQYARHQDRLVAHGEAEPAAPAAAGTPEAARGGGATYITHIQNARGLAIGDGARVIITSEDDQEQDADQQA